MADMYDVQREKITKKCFDAIMNKNRDLLPDNKKIDNEYYKKLVDVSERLISDVQYSYCAGQKFEIEKHYNIFNVNAVKIDGFNTIYWPWIIRVDDKLENPLGKYYMYYSTDHEYTTGGIGLAYSNNILEGFSSYGKIYQNVVNGEKKETETPSVIYDDKTKKFIMYFHSSLTFDGEDQTSWYVTSDDGINFDDNTKTKAFNLDHSKLMGDIHNGYLHPFRVGGRLYAYSLMGGGNACFSAVHMSDDGGYTWITDHNQMSAWNYDNKTNTLLNPFHGTIIHKYGMDWFIGTRTCFTSGIGEKTNSSIDIVPMKDLKHPIGKSERLITFDNAIYESQNIRQCTCFEDEGNIYILYQCDNIFNCAILR